MDAHTGEVVELRDTAHHQTVRNVKGGVFPVSNDGQAPDGNEEAGYPMPFADVTHGGGSTTADAGGNVFDVTGAMTTTLDGPFVRIDDTCGAITESTASGDLDLGTSDGTDCATPPGASPGNTHAARTTFYELNRIHEIARSHLPSNTWLQSQVIARVNVDNMGCGGQWTGTDMWLSATGTTCHNLGEVAGVIDHEWGHGLDDNDTQAGISNTGEGRADIFAALRLNDSCIGRGGFTSLCDAFGDPCIASFGCTGVRDIDWQRHESQMPHDVDWALANCGCVIHCIGQLSSESVWDLLKRDLPARYGFDDNTALEITTRLNFLGADNVGRWFSLENGDQGGCDAASGYQQFLAVDDDNGDLSDGTPHMQAIFDAHDRHQIACDTPVVQDSGCAGRPTVAPAVTTKSAAQGATLQWDPVPGATRYKIYRTDGPHRCDFGKAIAGETTDTTFDDGSLQNGREYYYVVAGFTDSDACMGPASACAAVRAGDLIFADGFETGDTSQW